MLQTLSASALLVWLGWETAWDLKDHNIPLWFSLVPLGAGLIWRAVNGDWLLAILMALLVISTNFSNPVLRIGFVGAIAMVALANLPAAWLPLLIGTLLSVVLFELGAMGGADALAVIYVLLWFPSWTALIALFAGTLLVSLIALIARYRRGAPKQFVDALRGLAAPTEAAGMGGFAAGFAAFLALQVIPH